MLSATPTVNQYKQHLTKYEGFRDRVYLCPSGIKTVGVGINLKAKNLDSKYNVGDKIDRALLDKWFLEEINKAKISAKKVFPSFESQPEKVQILLVSLTFNMGEGGIQKFKKFQKAIAAKDYDIAANELKDSKWYRQTGRRSKDYVFILNSV